MRKMPFVMAATPGCTGSIDLFTIIYRSQTSIPPQHNVIGTHSRTNTRHNTRNANIRNTRGHKGNKEEMRVYTNAKKKRETQLKEIGSPTIYLLERLKCHKQQPNRTDGAVLQEPLRQRSRLTIRKYFSVYVSFFFSWATGKCRHSPRTIFCRYYLIPLPI